MSASLLPPYLLEAVAAHGSARAAACARRTLRQDTHLRTARAGGEAPAPRELRASPGRPARTIFDAGGTEQLPGERVRDEGEAALGDPAADEAYDGLGLTWQLFSEAYGRDSLDDRGMPLLGTVHFGTDYANAFWDGRQMVFGDGDGELFNRFTASLDVIGHELTHGVVEFTAGLRYADQSGALNESIADVFGSLVKQRALGQTAEQADWLIGAELFTDRVRGEALRSMAAPGTAYDDPVLGKDPQPAHMDDFVVTQEDSGGVHINSGIPNRAFHLAATALGGRAWERAGAIWYAALTGDGIAANCDFPAFAALTLAAAERRGAEEAEAVRNAWAGVGVEVGSAASGPADPAGVSAPPASAPPADDDTPVQLGRSGGFAGLSRTREFRVGELPREDASAWKRLLAESLPPEWREDPPQQPDRYVYRVACTEAELDVRLPEARLPGWVRELFRRTLER